MPHPQNNASTLDRFAEAFQNGLPMFMPHHIKAMKYGITGTSVMTTGLSDVSDATRVQSPPQALTHAVQELRDAPEAERVDLRNSVWDVILSQVSANTPRAKQACAFAKSHPGETLALQHVGNTWGTKFEVLSSQGARSEESSSIATQDFAATWAEQHRFVAIFSTSTLPDYLCSLNSYQYYMSYSLNS